MGPAVSSGAIMQVSHCHPRSSIFATATAMPALIFSASKPGGREGSEKSTVSGFWPTNNTLVMWSLHSVAVVSDRRSRGFAALYLSCVLAVRHVAPLCDHDGGADRDPQRRG